MCMKTKDEKSDNLEGPTIFMKIKDIIEIWGNIALPSPMLMKIKAVMTILSKRTYPFNFYRRARPLDR